MFEAKGISSSPGVAIARAFVYRHDKLVIEHSYISPSDINKEIKRLEDCFDLLVEEYRKLLANAVEDSEKALYTVDILMLQDQEYHKSIKSLIREKHYSAQWATEEATEEIIKAISNIEDEYLKERIIDIRDIEYVVLETLSGKRRDHIEVKDKRILVADYLLTSELLGMEGLENIEGIALDSGGKTSHVSILAKSKGIPVVIALKDFSSRVEEGDLIALDAEEGTVVHEPGKKTKQEYEKKKAKRDKLLTSIEASRDECRTLDGHRVIVDANIEWLEAVDDALNHGAENIGLFRTEFIAIKDELNSRDKKDEIYQIAASKMVSHGHIVFRTLDIGGDKKTEVMEDEDNPILGWRAVRYMLSHEDEFRAQMRAILLASKYKNVRIMFPMISGVEELEECLSLFESEKRRMRKEHIEFDENIKVGTMIEIPSAALISDELAKMVDFFSIGTNDLVQYTIAVDRGNDKTHYLYNPLHPGVLRLIKLVVDNAHKEGIEVGLCGQMASEKLYLPILVGLGLDEISMSPSSIKEIKEELRALNFSDCLTLANEVLSYSSQKAIEKRIKEFFNERKTRNKK